MKHNRILLVRTGGTIDSEKYDLNNTPEYVETLKGPDSLIEPTLRKMANSENVDMFVWTSHTDEEKYVKDSKAFSPQDIKELADLMKNDDHKNFIITHGTDWMVRNARQLSEYMKDSGKTVIFVGAMIPLSVRPETSDGVDLLKYTLSHIDNAAKKPGVYLAGFDPHTKRAKFFDPQKVEKDFEASRDVKHQGQDQRLIFR